MGATVESLEQARPSATPSITRNRTNAARLFGYDIFISFALGPAPRGTRSYASDLARRLRELDFTVFFSEDEAPVGNQLDSTLRKALLRSHALVVVANRESLEDPRWVRTEVEEFRKAHPDRPIVPINVGGALQDTGLSASVHEWLRHKGTIWVDESQSAIDGGLTSDEVVNRLTTTPRFRKAQQRWRVTVSLVFVFLAALVVGLGIATWQVGTQWIGAKEQLAANYWSQAVSAKKGNDRLRAAHFYAKAAKELGPVLTYVSLTSKFGIGAQKAASDVLAQIRASLLNVHVDSHDILLGHVLQHPGAVEGVAFSQDEQRILTWSSDGTARLWDIGADYDFPVEHIPLLVEILTGTTMDNFGNIRALDSQGWKEKREQYIELAEKHFQACEFKTANLYEAQKQLWGVSKSGSIGLAGYGRSSTAAITRTVSVVSTTR